MESVRKSFKEWLSENVGVIDRNRVSSGIGSPPEPPFEDDGDNDDDAEWSWDNVRDRYTDIIQNWLDSDPFAKKCKGAALAKIFQAEPRYET